MELAVLAILASQLDPKIPCLCWDYRKVDKLTFMWILETAPPTLGLIFVG